ncbi:tRNA (adenosine(37)-N6)-threonylcarbamoyltransferase complex ATPase subunit type 1 TsaE [Candidatus Aerophobetes bacterium]|uniref:tRNA threonylcarbamoyladenosine biosynthesis protein TsaE n=1 Tax=Aerophobetes bacterium TaxID=2030807 RepID=A0A662DHN3_UNCAE|nr:MAG: tRNA (adenosine(37)-N6)-threonylcarbamoyltransferase complex ATPase subunit type 1 TsaE [Candidatus Aerophobetes bacterium]
MLTVYTESEEETLNLGIKIGENIFYPSLIALIGELGSGKTTLVRGIARGMGIKARVKSPSFIIINEYPGAIPLYHFDLYRLNDPQEINSLGYEEYFYKKEGVVVIEWADKILEFLPSDYLEIRLKVEDLERRKLVLLSRGDKKYSKLIEKLRENTKRGKIDVNTGNGNIPS